MLRFQVAYGERKSNGGHGEFVPQFVEGGQVAVPELQSLRAAHLETELMFSEALLRVVANVERT